MIRSMTGFGAASQELPAGTLTVEVKSVNHRHLNVSFRLPSGADAWESHLRAALGGRVRRGHVTFLVLAIPAPDRQASWAMDDRRIGATLEALRALREEYGIPGEVDLGLAVAATGELLRDEQADDLGWIDLDALKAVVREALDELVRMRELEGAHLEEDLRGSLNEIARALEAVQKLAPERLRRERERLSRAVAELAGGVRLEVERLEQEIALIADRWDIAEELVRAKAHLATFQELLDGDAAEPTGKRLGFLLQELNREFNTVGSKANDAEISRYVVEIKNALERLREQVENVE